MKFLTRMMAYRETMDSSNHALPPPHFAVGGRENAERRPPEAEWDHFGDAAEPNQSREVGTLLLRAADCLAAALAECTAEAGLNESRFRILMALERRTTGECSQSDLADLVLQSESNLSTLLERMGGDGLITRTRSQTDRRRSLIRITPAGQTALANADRTRAATIVRLMRPFSHEDATQLASGLERFVGGVERSLEGGARHGSGFESVVAASPPRWPRAGAAPSAESARHGP